MSDLFSLHQLATGFPPGHLNNPQSFALPVSEMTISLTASVLTLIWSCSQRWELRSLYGSLAQDWLIFPVACFRVVLRNRAPNTTFPQDPPVSSTCKNCLVRFVAHFVLLQTLKTLFSHLLMKCWYLDHAVKKYMYIYILKALLKSTVADQSFLGREDTSVSMSKGGSIMQTGEARVCS